MKKWPSLSLLTRDKEIRNASAPIVISASRRCDIPACGSEQFLSDLRCGYTRVPNPFNGKESFVSFCNTRLFIFWTKNPQPFFAVLNELDERKLNYYFQFTLNDYELEGFEAGVPDLNRRVEAFRQLSDRIGPDRVIWRFDPLVFTDRLSPEVLLKRVESLADRLEGYTRQLIFSFADIENYRKVRLRFYRAGVHPLLLSEEQLREIAGRLSAIGKSHSMSVSACSEEIDLLPQGISPSRCIDDRLIAALFPDDRMLMDFIFGNEKHIRQENQYLKIRDRGQRKACGCIVSKDIGQYQQCGYRCIYCYAR